MTDKLLSTKEVADRLNSKLSTVQLWIKKGLIPSVRVGHMYVVRESALEGFKRPKRGRKMPPQEEATE